MYHNGLFLQNVSYHVHITFMTFISGGDVSGVKGEKAAKPLRMSFCTKFLKIRTPNSDMDAGWYNREQLRKKGFNNGKLKSKK